MDEIYGSEGDNYGDEAAESESEVPDEQQELKTKKQLRLLKQQAESKVRALVDDLSDDDLAIEHTVTARKSTKSLPAKQQVNDNLVAPSKVEK